MEALFDWDATALDFFIEPGLRDRSDAARNQNDTEFQIEGKAVLDHRMSDRTKVKINELLNYTDDPSVEEGGETIREDQSYFLNRAEIVLGQEITRRSALDVFARSKVKRYDENEVAETSDEDRTDVGALLWHRVARTVGVLVQASYSDFTYDSPRGIERDFQSVMGAVGIEHAFSSNLRGGAKVGVQSQEFDDPGIDSETDPFGEVWIKGSTTPDLRLSGTVQRGVRDADAYPFAAQVYTDIRGRIEWDATPNVTFGLGGTYRLSDYDELDPSTAGAMEFPAATRSGDETTIIERADVTVKVAENTSIKIVQRYEDMDSDVGVSFTKNSASIGLTQHF
jgi:hypothetical protein